jgi:hypothetical protein
MSRSRTETVAKALGAGRPLGTVHLMVFVPSVDRDGRRLRGRSWTRATLRVLGELFRGATAFPRGLGVWRDDQRGGRLVFDATTIAFSYVASENLTAAALGRLRKYLHRMGQEARQGEIGLVLDGHYIAITDFEGDEK